MMMRITTTYILNIIFEKTYLINVKNTLAIFLKNTISDIGRSWKSQSMHGIQELGVQRIEIRHLPFYIAVGEREFV